jgi:uncharacterized membrane protein YeaQ/YmgE (transglycosylase-associated protein family)
LRPVIFDVRYAPLLWPLPALATASGAALCFEDHGLPAILGYVIACLLGACAGGLITLAFTIGEPESGGFWTSLVTAQIGTLVALGLWRALLEAVRLPGKPLPPSH